MKAIEGYEEIYSITNTGRVWSHERKGRLKGKWLKLNKNIYGYLHVILYKNKKTKPFLIHRLVAQAYIPNPENKPQINHLSGIKTDNSVSNLSWVTPKANHTHAWKNGLMDNLRQYGENNPASKLTRDQVDEIRNNHVSEEIMTRKPWDKYGICMGHYYNVLKGRRWIKNKIGVIA